MAKRKTIFICSECGFESPKWIGKCPDCGSWNSFQEMTPTPDTPTAAETFSTVEPVVLRDIEIKPLERLRTGIGEFDRILGGGIVPASVTLIAGDPGIGKSTLLLQVAGKLVEQGVAVLYVSGEESLEQVHLRAERLGLARLPLPVLAETELENILRRAEELNPAVVIVDSIQSIFSNRMTGTAGNVSQIRECSARLFRFAKEKNRAIFLIGHITKDGSIAGPKLLEHAVDTVIYFEGDQLYRYRLLRSLKNRFGSANEVGLFVMDRQGLQEVDNPSLLFLSHFNDRQPGTSVVSSFEGSRPLLAEVQALVSRSSYGVPQRTVSGFDHRRLSLLLAILEKHCNLNFSYSDVFVKIVGGVRLNDPGIDLGLALAVYSSLIDQPLKPRSLFIGEIGLSGEIRPVSQMQARIQEAVKLGFRHIYLPHFGKEEKNIQLPRGIKLIFKDHITGLIRYGSRGKNETPNENRQADETLD